jgi:hypothetical protein
MTLTHKYETYKDERNNYIFVECYQENFQKQKFWRYGYLTHNGGIIVGENLFTKPKKKTLMNIFNSDVLTKEQTTVNNY